MVRVQLGLLNLKLIIKPRFIRVKKINCVKAIKELTKIEYPTDLLEAFGVSKEAVENLKDTEEVIVNCDRIIGLSEQLPFGDGSDKMCQKLYFDNNAYWPIECLDEDTTNFLLLGKL